MPIKSKMSLPSGAEVEGVEVQTTESTERWSQFSLEDGTVLRLKFTVASFIRADGHFDADGNPVYAIKGQPMINFVSVPERFKKRGK
jgi:hypothetical protein